MNSTISKIKKWIKKNEAVIPIFILTILIFFIGIFVVGFLKSFLLVMVIALIYIGYEYGGTIMKRIKGVKKRKNEENVSMSQKSPKKKGKRKIYRVHKNSWFEIGEAFLACQDTGKRVQ